MNARIASLHFSKSHFTLHEATVVAEDIKFHIQFMHEHDDKYIFGPCVNVPVDCYLVDVAPGLQQVIHSPLSGESWKRIEKKLVRVSPQ